MTVIMPYMTDKYTAYTGDVISGNLSLAVWIIDDYTKKGPIGHIRVNIKEGNIKSVRNLSGYFFFTNLEDGNYTVSIESDLYFSEERQIDLSSVPDPKNPVIEISVIPIPAYPFRNNATLVRGLVVSNANPVVNAQVKAVEKGVQTLTDNNGEFALYLQGNKTESITIEIKNNGNTKTVTVIIEEGKGVSLQSISFP